LPSPPSCSVAGTIIGLNFYKSATNTGVHVGNLWDATGKINLGTVTFTNETASGWQTANFATPIAIAANTTYIISYHATVDYAGTESFLPTAAPLKAGVLTASVSNGVTQFGPGGFNNASSPAGSFDSEWNYFVDPIFQTAPGVNSSNTRVTNNFASQIWVFNGHTPSMPPPDHNVAVGPQTSNHGVMYWGGAGNATIIDLFKSSDANGNVAVNTGPAGQVVQFDPVHGLYDLHLLPTSLAVGKGSPVAGVGAPLPANDITGTPRVSAPPDGAYRKAR
jgi:hypothetical protein